MFNGHRLGESRIVGCRQGKEQNRLGLDRKEQNKLGLDKKEQGLGNKVLELHTTVEGHRTPSVEVHSWASAS